MNENSNRTNLVIGLIDSIISMARVLSHSDLNDPAIQEALSRMCDDESVIDIMNIEQDDYDYLGDGLINKLKKWHGDKLDYSDYKYDNDGYLGGDDIRVSEPKYLTLRCPIHGEIRKCVQAWNYRNAYCSKCRKNERESRNRFPRIDGFYVYVYYNGDDALYVGQTTNISRRYQGHKAKSKWFGDATHYEICVVDDYYDMMQYEAYYIRELKPKYNKNIPVILKDFQYSNVDFIVSDGMFTPNTYKI